MMTVQHVRKCILTLQSERSSKQCSLQGKWWLLISGMFTEFFGWFHTSRFNNKCSCLTGNSKETQGVYSEQEPGFVDQRTQSSSFARQCSTSQCYRNRESLELLGQGNSPTSTTQFWFGNVGLPCIPKHEKAPQKSAFPLQWRCSKWSQEMVTCPGRIFSFMNDLTNWYIALKSV
jgi:hypothetical protein